MGPRGRPSCHCREGPVCGTSLGVGEIFDCGREGEAYRAGKSLLQPVTTLSREQFLMTVLNAALGRGAQCPS